METKKQRRLAAIMFTDIVGYSNIMQHDEAKGIIIRKRHREIFEKITLKYEGELLQYFGDGTLSIFPSAAAAVECAVDMQKKFQIDPQVPLRIGIHTGDITFATDDAYGHGMNIAARIEPMCIPGGIYISGKVYEDISNHEWLKATSLGFFELKNINDAIEIFAVSNEGVNTPEFEVIKEKDTTYIPPVQKAYSALQSGVYEDLFETGYKKRKAAAITALLFGIFGVHRFYLGQRKKGITHFVFSMIGIVAGVWFFIVIPALVGFVDAMTFFAMSDEDFNAKFNSGKRIPEAHKKPTPSHRHTSTRRQRQQAKPIVEEEIILTPAQKAKKSLGIGDFDSAIASFAELLQGDPENCDLHFSLASCYSMKQDAKNGFYHLSKAVEFGYKDIKRIKNHFTLAFLRSRNDFQTFEKNGYRLAKMLPSPQENLLDSERPLLLNKLEKIEELGELLYRGEITEEEFTSHKKSLLEN